MIKQRISGDFYFMKENVCVGLAQANGHCVADEVNFVASRSQFNAEFGGHHARTAIGRITGNANFHAGLVHWLIRELRRVYFALMRCCEPSVIHFGTCSVARSLAAGEAAMLDLRVLRALY